MDSLDDLTGAESHPVDLHDLVGDALPSIELPLATQRNRAAKAASLSPDPSQAASNFQLMMGENGSAPDSTTQNIQKTVGDSLSRTDLQGMMNLLADKSVPLEQKQSAITSFKNNQFLKETNVTVMSGNLVKDSPGENANNEKARLTTADLMKDIQGSIEQVEAIRNAHGAELSTNPGLLDVADFLATTLFSPFSNVQVGRVNQEMLKLKGGGTFLDKLQGYMVAGSTMKNLHDWADSLQPAERVKFAQALKQAVTNNAGIVMGNDNQMNQVMMMDQIIGEGGYGSGQAFLDNIAPVLDLVGVGELFKGGKGAFKAAQAASEAKQVTQGTAKVAETVVEGSKAPVDLGVRPRNEAEVRSQVAGHQDRLITALEDERSGLVGSAGNLADKGTISSAKKEIEALNQKKASIFDDVTETKASKGVSAKEAHNITERSRQERLADIENQIARLQSTIDEDAAASKASQRIDAIDKELSDLRANRIDAPGGKTEISDLISRMRANDPVSNPVASSLSSIAHNTNPSQARTLFSAVVKSEGNTVAEATHGVSRAEAIASDVLPQMASPAGKVLTKTMDISRGLRQEVGVPEEVLKLINSSGANELTAAEKAQAESKIVRSFRDAEGLSINEAMGGLVSSRDGRVVNIQGVYGQGDGAFSNAQDAYRQALHALRNTNTKPEDIQILGKNGLFHEPVDLKAVGDAEGQYFVRVNTNQEISTQDIASWENLDTKLNWFDRIPSLVWNDKGSLTRYLFDIGSTAHPKISGPAVTAIDQAAKFEKSLLQIAEQFSDVYTKLDKGMQEKVRAYILEANFKGLPLDKTDLIARGINAEGIDSLTKWRNYWDVNFYLENYDAIRTLRNEGFQLFDTKNLRVVAKPTPKNRNIGRVYDPLTDSVVTISDTAVDNLYSSNGFVAKTKRPVVVNGESFDHMVVRNTPTETLRNITDNDMILNKRDGYFQLKYNNPRFVDEFDPSTGITRAVAVAKDTPSAEAWVANKTSNGGGVNGKTYTVRADDRALRAGSDDWMDVNSAQGRLAQRHRGQLLESADTMTMIGDATYIVDPVDSAVAAARSVAMRTEMRPLMENMTERFMKQFADVLPEKNGQKVMPNDLSEIGAKGRRNDPLVADARHAFQYMRYLQAGYINSIDEVYKGLMNAMATTAGSKGFGRTERALMKVGDSGPTGSLKSGVSLAYITGNPIRQLLVQSHQMVRTLAYNPTGWITGGVPKLTMGYAAEKAGINTVSEVKDFVKFVESTGLLDAVDKSNLVRGSLMHIADNSSNKLTKGLHTVAAAGRKIGYDPGEAANSLATAAAVYDRFKRLGYDLKTKDGLQRAHDEVRALTGDMNFAGDMPYNSAAPSMVLQFLQAPHKMFLQPLNRRLDTATKARLIIGDTLMWGGPATLISAVLGGDILPDNPEDRELLVHGLEGVLLNRMWNGLFDEKTNIDYSSLAPSEINGFAKALGAFMNDGMLKTIADSPAGQLFFGSQGRIQQAMGSVSRLMGFSEPINQTPEDWKYTLSEIAKISSGINNFDKARVALQFHATYNKYGERIDGGDTTAVEAINLAFGFGPMEAQQAFAASQAITKKNDQRKKEILDTYKTIKQYVQDQVEQGNTTDRISMVSSSVLSAYKDDLEAQEIIVNQMALDFTDPNDKLLRSMLKVVGIKGASELKDTFRQSGLPQEDINKVLSIIDDFNTAK